jgi:hypothetical protein
MRPPITAGPMLRMVMFFNTPSRLGSVGIAGGAGKAGAGFANEFAIEFPFARAPRRENAGTAAATNSREITSHKLTPTVFRVIRVLPPRISSKVFSRFRLYSRFPGVPSQGLNAFQKTRAVSYQR